MDPGYYDTFREQNPRETANIISRFMFWHTIPIFSKGWRGQLQISDAYRCSPNHRAATAGDKLGREWQKELLKKENGRDPSLLKVILRLYGLKFLVLNVAYSFLDTFSKLALPLCLEGLITYFSPSHGGLTRKEAYLYGFGVIGLMAVSASTFHSMLLWLLNTATKIRVGCCSLIYRKLLHLDLTVGGKASEGLAGHVVNLLTTDAQRFDMACLFITDLVRTPIESSIIIYLMYTKIGVASLVGVTFLLSFIPLQGYLGKISSRFRKKTAIRTDNRIRLMNEVIQSIEAIKMYTWENFFAKIIGEARRKEMNIIRKSSWLRAVMLGFVKLNTRVAILLSIISYISFGNPLTAAKVFVIFVYYDILKLTLVEFFPMAISFSLEAYVSLKRIQEFLLLPEVDGEDLTVIDQEVQKDGFVLVSTREEPPIKSGGDTKPQGLISMKDFNAYWQNVDDDKLNLKVAALTDINLIIQPQTLTTIVGVVGSGKSTLLQAMLREITPSSGHLQVKGVIAYASQDPWLFEASVRQNILFGQEMDHHRYQKVIRCCQLKSDLEILSHGDKTIVGERGVSLSGGQRARISLARCVYQNADVYLLDDPLAAVDAKVAQAIYADCVRGFLHDKATVLVTHHVQYARQADNVCVMRGGKIVGQGKYNELKNSVPEFEALLEVGEKTKEDHEKLKRTISMDSQDTLEWNMTMKYKRSPSVVTQLSQNTSNDVLEPKYEGEEQCEGKVDNKVYLAYMKSGGTKWTLLLMLSLFAIAQMLYSSSDIWLKEWVNLEEAIGELITNRTNNTPGTLPAEANLQDLPTNTFGLSREQCLYIYAGLIVTSMLFTCNNLVLFYNTCIKASTNLHDNMFRGVTYAPMWFFHHNPSGRILNRFSKDLGQVDTLLPMALVDCLGFFLEGIAIMVVVCLVNWWLLLPTAVLIILLFFLRDVFLSTSRDLKRIEAIARSQSLSHLSASVTGLTTIRSTGHQRTLAKEFDKLQDLHSSAWALVLYTTRAFGLWMDMICCIYMGLVIYSFFFLPSDVSMGGNIGLAITQVIGLVGMCQYGMTQTAEVENHMTSVERILEYTNLPAEPPMETDEVALKKSYPHVDWDKWPNKGEIIFDDVSLQYEKPPHDGEEPEEPAYAIRNVSFTINPAEKVAVVGRTGAGKSSLINALFRLSRVSGSILVDGLPATTGLRAWRSRLCALPQRPALFASTLRDNLDPTGRYTDKQIYDALEQVQLTDMVAKLPAGLSTKVGDGGGNLSSGQRQLLCMARAALAQSKVLVLDEATANVDTETDKHIQLTIRSTFASATVLTIAHRLNTVMDYDRVIVMDKGRVVETGHPYELLHKDTIQNDVPPKRPTNNQAPLAIPEEFEHQHELERLDEQHALLRSRTYSSRSEASEPESTGIFKSLVEQTGKETAAMLYKMAEESYQRLLEKKKTL